MTGCLVPPPPWTGKVVGVFSKAVAVLHPDGAIVSIVSKREHLESRAMMPAEGWPGFIRALSRLVDSGIDAEIGWDGSTLAMTGEAGASGPGARLEFTGSVVWDPRLRSHAPVPFDRITVASLIGVIEKSLASAHAKGRLAEGIHDNGAFRAAFERLRLTDGFPANIVGFGPGTTPAGDDWLAGFLAACDLVAGGYGTAEKDLRNKLFPYLGRTTPAGRALLLGAIAGVPPAYLDAVVMATERYLASESQHVTGVSETAKTVLLTETVEVALDHGATSGEDALAGFIEGLRHSTG